MRARVFLTKRCIGRKGGIHPALRDVIADRTQSCKGGCLLYCRRHASHCGHGVLVLPGTALLRLRVPTWWRQQNAGQVAGQCCHIWIVQDCSGRQLDSKRGTKSIPQFNGTCTAQGM